MYTIPNVAGFQVSYSGQGYTHSIQIAISYPRDFTFFEPPYENVQYRESFGGSFTKPLEKGIHYIEFFVSFADYGKTGAYPDGRVATNAFDLILLDDSSSIYNSVSPYINLNDVIKVHDEQTVINDTINWVKLSTCFNAKGGETFFALGAFRDTSEIIVEFSGHSNFNIYQAYYFYDNIKIYKCPTCCPDEFPSEEQVNVFSNPSTQNNPASLQMWLFPNTSGDLTIYDSAGRLIASKKYSDLLNTFIFENFASGMYHYKFKTSDGIENYGKILVQ